MPEPFTIAVPQSFTEPEPESVTVDVTITIAFPEPFIEPFTVPVTFYPESDATRGRPADVIVDHAP